MRSKKNIAVFTLSLVSILIFLSGCRCTDGGFVYHLSGTLIDTSGTPITDTSMGITYREEGSPPYTKTDGDGYFEAGTRTGITWGGCIPLGLWDPQAPVPRNPGILYLWHKDKNGKWRQTEVVIKDEYIIKAVRGELYIHMDTIQAREQP